MNLIKAIIVENDLEFLKAFEMMLSKIPEVLVIHTCADIDSAYTAILELKPDLVFLDIKLNGGDAFELISRFNTFEFEIVFTTAFDEYALDAIKLYALHYLLKPFGLHEVKEALNRLADKKESEFFKKNLRELMSPNKEEETKIALHTSDGIQLVLISDIIYCKSDNSYTTFCLKSDNFITVSNPLKKYEDLLINRNFIRIHQSYLINVKAVSKLVKNNGNYVVLSNNLTLPISRRKLEELIQYISKIAIL
jgi:two-component system, LytTR family, response regulator